MGKSYLTKPVADAKKALALSKIVCQKSTNCLPVNFLYFNLNKFIT